jgi:hypothetical protein
LHMALRSRSMSHTPAIVSGFKTLFRFACSMLVLPILLGGCRKERSQTQPVSTTTNTGQSSTVPPSNAMHQQHLALIRIVDTLPDAAALDVFADDNKLFNDLRFATVTPYAEISAERHTLRVRQSAIDASAPYAQRTEAMSAGKHYTVVVIPETRTDAALYVIHDDLTPPSHGKAKIRVIDAAPDVRRLDVYSTGRKQALFRRVTFGTDTSYEEIPPVSGTLTVRETDGNANANLATLPATRFDAEKIYTIVVSGKGNSNLQVITVEDQLGP